MKATTLKTKSVTELLEELRESLREQFNLRMQKGFNAEKVKPHALKKVRRYIAQIKTVLHEKGADHE
jgi:large subunit ribosomal protein L29